MSNTYYPNKYLLGIFFTKRKKHLLQSTDSVHCNFFPQEGKHPPKIKVGYIEGDIKDKGLLMNQINYEDRVFVTKIGILKVSSDEFLECFRLETRWKHAYPS